MSSFEAMSDYVVVRPVQEGQTDSGLFTIGSLDRNMGTVVSVGPGVLLESGEHLELPISVGEEVLYSGDVFSAEIDGETYLIMKMSNILVKFNN